MARPHVRIFPHSQKEFPSEDSLRTWLLNGLRGRGGLYYLVDPHAVKDIPPGSIVLFRYGQKIVGEAVVWKGKEVLPEKVKERTLSGDEEVEYGARVTFAPSSVRLYAPPLPVEQIQPHVKGKDIVTFAGGRYELDWNIYACVLEEVISRGTFIS